MIKKTGKARAKDNGVNNNNWTQTIHRLAHTLWDICHAASLGYVVRKNILEQCGFPMHQYVFDK